MPVEPGSAFAGKKQVDTCYSPGQGSHLGCQLLRGHQLASLFQFTLVKGCQQWYLPWGPHWLGPVLLLTSVLPGQSALEVFWLALCCPGRQYRYRCCSTLCLHVNDFKRWKGSADQGVQQGKSLLDWKTLSTCITRNIRSEFCILILIVILDDSKKSSLQVQIEAFASVPFKTQNTLINRKRRKEVKHKRIID